MEKTRARNLQWHSTLSPTVKSNYKQFIIQNEKIYRPLFNNNVKARYFFSLYTWPEGLYTLTVCVMRRARSRSRTPTRTQSRLGARKIAHVKS